MSESLDIQEIIRIAAEAGAKAAMETLERERKVIKDRFADQRLYNTKLLLRNYRMFRAHVENAVYEAEESESPEEILADLMMRGSDQQLFVESIKRSVARTRTIVRHMATMIDLYKVYCFNSNTPEDLRRWRVVHALYVSDEVESSVSALADAEGVVARTIYKDIDIACERIAALMFGIDGIRK